MTIKQRNMGVALALGELMLTGLVAGVGLSERSESSEAASPSGFRLSDMISGCTG